jgi:hypothetical protein
MQFNEQLRQEQFTLEVMQRYYSQKHQLNLISQNILTRFETQFSRFQRIMQMTDLRFMPVNNSYSELPIFTDESHKDVFQMFIQYLNLISNKGDKLILDIECVVKYGMVSLDAYNNLVENHLYPQTGIFEYGETHQSFLQVCQERANAMKALSTIYKGNAEAQPDTTTFRLGIFQRFVRWIVYKSPFSRWKPRQVQATANELYIRREGQNDGAEQSVSIQINPNRSWFSRIRSFLSETYVLSGIKTSAFEAVDRTLYLIKAIQPSISGDESKFHGLINCAITNPESARIMRSKYNEAIGETNNLAGAYQYQTEHRYLIMQLFEYAAANGIEDSQVQLMYENSCRHFDEMIMSNSNDNFFIRTRISSYFKHLFAICHLKIQLDEIAQGESNHASAYSSYEKASLYAYHVFSCVSRQQLSDRNPQNLTSGSLSDYFAEQQVDMYFQLLDEAITAFHRILPVLSFGTFDAANHRLRIAFVNSYIQLKQTITAKNISSDVLGTSVENYCTLYALSESVYSDFPILDLPTEQREMAECSQGIVHDSELDIEYNQNSSSFVALYSLIRNNASLEFLGTNFAENRGAMVAVQDESFRIYYACSVSQAINKASSNQSDLPNRFGILSPMLEQYDPLSNSECFSIHIQAINNAIQMSYQSKFYRDHYHECKNPELLPRVSTFYTNLLAGIIRSASKIAFKIYESIKMRQWLSEFGIKSYVQFHYYFMRRYTEWRLAIRSDSSYQANTGRSANDIFRALANSIHDIKQISMNNSIISDSLAIFNDEMVPTIDSSLGELASKFIFQIAHSERIDETISPEICEAYTALQVAEVERRAQATAMSERASALEGFGGAPEPIGVTDTSAVQVDQETNSADSDLLP